MLSVLLILSSIAASVAAQSDAALVAQLKTANTQVAEIEDVLQNASYVFNFLAGPRGNAQGGFAVSANSANFAALLTGNGAMTVGVLGPCGANSPHTHPRATEIQIITSGGPVYTEFIQENGAPPVSNNVSVGSATVFPKGSVHFQQNLGCEPTVFVASFDNVDPGTVSIAQVFFALDPGVVKATLGDIGADILDNLTLPANFILGTQACLDSCNLSSDFNFSSDATFKDFAAFSNSTWAVPSSSYASSGKSSSVKSSSGFLADTTVNVPFSQNPLRSVVIGLGTATGALAVAFLALLVTMFLRRRSGVKVAPRFPGGGAVGGSTYNYATPYEESESLRRSTEKI